MTSEERPDYSTPESSADWWRVSGYTDGLKILLRICIPKRFQGPSIQLTSEVPIVQVAKCIAHGGDFILVQRPSSSSIVPTAMQAAVCPPGKYLCTGRISPGYRILVCVTMNAWVRNIAVDYSSRHVGTIHYTRTRLVESMYDTHRTIARLCLDRTQQPRAEGAVGVIYDVREPSVCGVSDPRELLLP